jgi:hypothetical protein
VVHGGVAVLLLAQLLEEGVFVDCYGRHICAIWLSLSILELRKRIGLLHAQTSLEITTAIDNLGS